MGEGALDPGLARLREELSQEIRSSGAETRAHAQALFADHGRQTDARFAEMWQRTDTRFAEADAQIVDTRHHAEALATENRRHAEGLAADTRRHFDVVAEGLLSKIQLVGEGVTGVDQKVERLREEMQDGFARVDRRFLRLEARVAALERR